MSAEPCKRTERDPALDGPATRRAGRGTFDFPHVAEMVGEWVEIIPVTGRAFTARLLHVHSPEWLVEERDGTRHIVVAFGVFRVRPVRPDFEL